MASGYSYEPPPQLRFITWGPSSPDQRHELARFTAEHRREWNQQQRALKEAWEIGEAIRDAIVAGTLDKGEVAQLFAREPQETASIGRRLRMALSLILKGTIHGKA